MRHFFVIAICSIIVLFGVFWIVTEPLVVSADVLPSYSPDVSNGEMVFNAGGCAACHAGKNQPRTFLGGGLAIRSPFGTFYAPNISPDPNDGIGNWSEANFVTAVTKGTSPSGQHYFPAFPYNSYQKAKVDDVRDLFAYLKTLPPVAGKAPAHDVKFPFNIRRLIGGWKLLFLDGEPLIPDPKQTPQWNRGAYLVNALGHCAECHSPRNALGGIVAAQRFAGGPDFEDGGWVPNITQKGLKDTPEAELADFLKNGELMVGGSMVPVVQNLARLSDADRLAIAAYLKSLPPVDGPPRPKKS